MMIFFKYEYSNFVYIKLNNIIEINKILLINYPAELLTVCISGYTRLSSSHQNFASEMDKIPLNIYSTSPRTSVMFHYYNQPKGSYMRHHQPLIRYIVTVVSTRLFFMALVNTQ